MSDLAELPGPDTDFLLVMRRVEEMWRQGFTGRITIHCAGNGGIKLESTTFETPEDLRREEKRKA